VIFHLYSTRWCAKSFYSKPFLALLLALALLAALDQFIAWGPVNAGLNEQLRNYLSHKLDGLKKQNAHPLDVLMIGTSRSLYGFSPPVFTQTAPQFRQVFNMGLVAGDYYLFKLFLQDYIATYGKPRLILLEACDLILNTDRTSDTNNIYYRTLLLQNPHAFQQIIQSPMLSVKEKEEILLGSVSGLYRYRTLLAPANLKNLIFHPAMTRQNNLSMAALNGWTPRTITLADETPNDQAELIQKRVDAVYGQYQHINLTRLVDLLAFCRAQHIPVVLMEWPVHPAFQQKMDAIPVAKRAQQSIEALQKQFHLRMITLPAPPLPEANRYFSDADHLSEEGALVYTRRLAETLK